MGYRTLLMERRNPTEIHNFLSDPHYGVQLNAHVVVNHEEEWQKEKAKWKDHV